MIVLNLHDQAGNPTGQTYSFEETEIADRISLPLLHSVLVMYAANRRLGTAKSKSRAEVAGCSKKMYKQKGTGNARAGNKRTPVRRGGGHCFAKRPKDWRISIPRVARRTATRMAFLGKLRAGQVFLVDKIQLDTPKTSAIVKLIGQLGLQGRSGIVTISKHDELLWKSCRNIPRVALSTAAELNASTLLRSGYVIATKDAMDAVRNTALSYRNPIL